MKKTENNFYKNHYNEHHPVFAAIDLGTNSCRLLIASVNIAALKKTPFRIKPNFLAWKTLDTFGKVVCLGEGIYKNKKLTDDAINRTLDVLKICKKKIDLYKVHSVRAVATEACRRSENAVTLIERAKGELGIDIEVISSDEEARLALAGCITVLDSRAEYAFFFDIGGGSTELVWVKILPNGRKRPGYPVPFEIIDSTSIPFGVVTVSEKYEKQLFQTTEYAAISEEISTYVHAFIAKNNISEYFKRNFVQLFGSSGTITTLAAIHLGLKKYTRYAVDKYDFAISSFKNVVYNIKNMSQEEHNHYTYVGSDRISLVLGGAAILDGICSTIPIESLRIADRGIREGILSEMIANINKNK